MSNDQDHGKIGKAEKGFIRKKARQLVGKSGFTRWDIDDICQELTLRLFRAMLSFDPNQGHWAVFVTTVVERSAASLLRDKRAEKRDHRRVRSLNVVIADDEHEGPVELGDTVGRRELDARLGQASRDEHDLAQLALDIAGAIAGLSPEMRELAERLKTDSVSQIARDLGVPRTTLNDRVRELRRQFEDAGLRDYL